MEIKLLGANLARGIKISEGKKKKRKERKSSLAEVLYS